MHQIGLWACLLDILSIDACFERAQPSVSGAIPGKVVVRRVRKQTEGWRVESVVKRTCSYRDIGSTISTYIVVHNHL